METNSKENAPNRLNNAQKFIIPKNGPGRNEAITAILKKDKKICSNDEIYFIESMYSKNDIVFQINRIISLRPEYRSSFEKQFIVTVYYQNFNLKSLLKRMLKSKILRSHKFLDERDLEDRIETKFSDFLEKFSYNSDFSQNFSYDSEENSKKYKDVTKIEQMIEHSFFSPFVKLLEDLGWREKLEENELIEWCKVYGYLYSTKFKYIPTDISYEKPLETKKENNKNQSAKTSNDEFSPENIENYLESKSNQREISNKEEESNVYKININIDEVDEYEFRDKKLSPESELEFLELNKKRLEQVKMDLEVFENCLNKIPDDNKQAREDVRKVDFEGIPQKELAKMTKRSEEAVRTSLTRGRKLLNDLLLEHACNNVFIKSNLNTTAQNLGRKRLQIYELVDLAKNTTERNIR